MKLLNLSEQHVFCNKIYFHDGKYGGFDRDLLINQPQGKRLIIQQFMQTHKFIHSVMIGDGSTDLETTPVVDCFIGYGGVVERTLVKENASFFTTSFPSLHSAYLSNDSIFC